MKKFLIPEQLETERLTLRMFRNDDWADLHQYYSDEVCMKYTAGHALDEGESWRKVAAMAGHWLLHGYGPYAIVEKATDIVVGPVGLWYPREWPEPEIKWGLAREHWGKGFAKEAALAVRNMAAEFLPEIKLISLIHPENHGSKRLAEAIGATYEKTVPFGGEEASIYRHLPA